jgi:hypothetical protein
MSEQETEQDVFWRGHKAGRLVAIESIEAEPCSYIESAFKKRVLENLRGLYPNE